MTTSLESLRRIREGGLCHRCGACAGICPCDVLRPDADMWPSCEGREGDCTDCGLCVKVCPGASFSFPEHYRGMFGREADPALDRGVWLKAFLGHTTDPDLRARTTSGGLGTAIPLYLLERGRIRGALAVRSDPARAWAPQAFVARTREDLMSARYSKYPACSMNHLFRELKDEPGPLLYTGIPCQLHGLHRMAALQRRIGDKIGMTVGLFCHSCLDPAAVRDMLDAYGVAEGDLEQVTYRFTKLPGHVRARLRDGREVGLPYPFAPLSAYRPNAKELLTFLFKFYSPLRCRLCLDATAEFCDIAISDPWIQGWQGRPELRDGWNYLLARTPRGLALLEDMQRDGAIALEPFPEAEARVAQMPMIRSKRLRAWYNLECRKLAGEPAPDHGMVRILGRSERRRAAFSRVTYFAADRPELRRRIARFLLSRTGRWFVGAVFFRRRVLVAALERIKARFRTRPTPAAV